MKKTSVRAPVAATKPRDEEVGKKLPPDEPACVNQLRFNRLADKLPVDGGESGPAEFTLPRAREPDSTGPSFNTYCELSALTGNHSCGRDQARHTESTEISADPTIIGVKNLYPWPRTERGLRIQIPHLREQSDTAPEPLRQSVLGENNIGSFLPTFRPIPDRLDTNALESQVSQHLVVRARCRAIKGCGGGLLDHLRILTDRFHNGLCEAVPIGGA